MPAARPSSLMCSISSMPTLAAMRSRNSIISLNFQVVLTCISGNGGVPG